MSKVVIHEFIQPIFPFQLWVCLGANGKILSENFNDIEETFDDHIKRSYATVFKGEYKDGRYGVLVYSGSKKLEGKHISHEATHCTQCLLEHIGERNILANERSEIVSYLNDYYFDCINQVSSNKIRK